VSDDLELNGRRALVTGGTQGIGEALANAAALGSSNRPPTGPDAIKLVS
jgi:hypothetical protein